MNEYVSQAILSTPGCFRSSATNPFILKCRELSLYYIDLRSLNSFPKQRDVAVKGEVDLVTQEIRSKIDKFVTTESAGIPICSMVADRLGIGMAYVKKEEKAYGLGKKIEGVINKDELVVGIDDLTTEATTATKVIKEVRDVGAVINDYCVIHDRNQGAAETLEKLNIRLRFLSRTTPRFMEMAAENGLVKEGYLPLLREYAENPTKWSRDYVAKNPEFIRGKLAGVVKDGKITDMAPLEVLTVAHPELKAEYETLVNKWLVELGVKQDVPEFGYVAPSGGGAQVIG